MVLQDIHAFLAFVLVVSQYKKYKSQVELIGGSWSLFLPKSLEILTTQYGKDDMTLTHVNDK